MKKIILMVIGCLLVVGCSSDSGNSSDNSNSSSNQETNKKDISLHYKRSKRYMLKDKKVHMEVTKNADGTNDIKLVDGDVPKDSISQDGVVKVTFSSKDLADIKARLDKLELVNKHYDIFESQQGKVSGGVMIAFNKPYISGGSITVSSVIGNPAWQQYILTNDKSSVSSSIIYSIPEKKLYEIFGNKLKMPSAFITITICQDHGNQCKDLNANNAALVHKTTACNNYIGRTACKDLPQDQQDALKLLLPFIQDLLHEQSCVHVDGNIASCKGVKYDIEKNYMARDIKLADE